MTKEEKAKAYDKALETARRINSGEGVAAPLDWTICEVIFPELKESESEDEGMRQRIIKAIRLRADDMNEEWSDEIAWLEKQKEQKPSINIEQLKSLMLQYFQEAANKKDDSAIEADTDKWARKILGYDFEQKPVEGEWPNLSNCIRNCKKCPGKCLYRKEPYEEQKPTEWNEEDKALFELLHQCVCRCINDDRMIYSERERISKTMIPFIEKLQALHPQSKAEWSEEDEKIRQSIIKDIEFSRNYMKATTGKVIEKYNEQIAWLKYLPFNLKKKNEDVAKLCSAEWSEDDEEN